MDAIGRDEQEAPQRFVDGLSWFAPLLAPTWLLPGVGKDAPRVELAAEPWPQESALDQDARDLRLGLPLFLAEGIRYLTNALPSVRPEPVASSGEQGGAEISILTSIVAGRPPVIKIRLVDAASGDERESIEREVESEADLGAVLVSLPRVTIDLLRSTGVRSSWDPRYTPPPPASAARVVRGHRACVRLADPAFFTAESADRRAAARDEATVVLRRLADAATSTSEALPAVLFFATLVGATGAGFDATNEFRLSVNARCMDATDPRDPVFRLSVIALRAIGDEAIAERRAQRLETVEDPVFQDWLERARKA
ncbi:MAG TPA: hypothetical protein VNG34_04970 [Actinomycetota bacterium]|nr:hypothetical protein [Actinomycetota bacterium]